MIDNYALYVAHERRQAEALKRLPICVKCQEPILSDKAYDLDGLYCEECFQEWAESISKWTDDIEVDIWEDW